MNHRIVTTADTAAAQLLAAALNPTIWRPVLEPVGLPTIHHRPGGTAPVNLAVHGVVNCVEVTVPRLRLVATARRKPVPTHGNRVRVAALRLGFDNCLTHLREADDIGIHRSSPTRGGRSRAATGQGGEGI